MFSDTLRAQILSFGAGDVGFSRVDDGPEGLPYAISIVFPLSPAVIDEIDGEPTHTYFHHYRTVNAHLDSVALKTGLFLMQNGYKYLPVAASQSINNGNTESFSGRYSHKKAACMAGLGGIGRNNLFLHRTYGPAVRLATVFTDAPLAVGAPLVESLCSGCDLCVKACPALALTGADWTPGCRREDLFDPAACSSHMKTAYQHIGRGSVCGICIKVCPIGK
jgi:epoxyqueuosine reductase QueG